MVSPSLTGALLQRVQQKLSSVELVYKPHDRWPLPVGSISSNRALRVAVLDSSFNPPTLAHLALANAPPTPADPIDNSNNNNNNPESDHDAKLLLLSVRNADKQLKSGDATYSQRLDMMLLLAHNIRVSAPDPGPGTPPFTHPHTHPRPSPPYPNVAVAIIDEPTFVGKSSTLLAFLRQHHPQHRHQLIFLQGVDTLERLLAPRYYPSEAVMRDSLRTFFDPEGDASRVVCARRVSSAEAEDKERERRTLAAAQEFVDAGCVSMIDIGEERAYSSSEVREKIAQGKGDWKRFVPESVAKYIEEQRLYTV